MGSTSHWEDSEIFLNISLALLRIFLHLLTSSCWKKSLSRGRKKISHTRSPLRLLHANTLLIDKLPHSRIPREFISNSQSLGITYLSLWNYKLAFHPWRIKLGPRAQILREKSSESNIFAYRRHDIRCCFKNSVTYAPEMTLGSGETYDAWSGQASENAVGRGDWKPCRQLRIFTNFLLVFRRANFLIWKQSSVFQRMHLSA